MAGGSSSRAPRIWRALKQLFGSERLPPPPSARPPDGTIATLWRMLTESEELPPAGEVAPAREPSFSRWLISHETLPDEGAPAARRPRATEEVPNGRR